MSAPALEAGGPPAVRFRSTGIGKKILMAASGLILAGFVVGHLLGNLQIFLGREAFNRYALSLQELPGLVWSVRALLAAMVALHVVSSIQLALLKRRARPVAYSVRPARTESTYASRTMYVSGPLLALFVVYHLMQFTFGVGGTAYSPDDAYGNVMAGFRNPAVSAVYILSMAVLCLHLRHGLASMFQTLGVHHPRHTVRLGTAATAVSVLIFLGYVSIPAAVLARLLDGSY